MPNQIQKQEAIIAEFLTATYSMIEISQDRMAQACEEPKG